MEKGYKFPDGIHSFFLTVYVFYAILIGSFGASGLSYLLKSGFLYDLFISVFLLLLQVGGILSAIWFVLLFVWCFIIARKEKSTEIFKQPQIIVTIMLIFSHFLAMLYFLK